MAIRQKPDRLLVSFPDLSPPSNSAVRCLFNTAGFTTSYASSILALRLAAGYPRAGCTSGVLEQLERAAMLANFNGGRKSPEDHRVRNGRASSRSVTLQPAGAGKRRNLRETDARI